MTKRILTFVLVLCMVSGVLFASAEDMTTGVLNDYESAYTNLVDDLGILSGIEPTDEPVSRGNFVKALASCISYTMEGNCPYTDIQDAAVQRAVILLSALGAVNGNADGTFDPDSPVTLTQAAKMMMAVAGRTTRANYSGGYPGGYIKEANETGLFTGISGGYDQPLKGRDLPLLFANFLQVEVAELEVYNDYFTERYEIGKKVMSVYLGIYEKRGRLNATSGTSLLTESGEPLDKEEAIIIGDINYNTELMYIDSYIGFPLIYFYVEKEGYVNPFVVSASISGQHHHHEISTVDVADVSFEDGMRYYVQDKEKALDFEDDVIVIFNGKYAKDFDYSLLKQGENTINAYDWDKDKKIDLIHLNFCTYYVVKANPYDGYIEDLYGLDPLYISDNNPNMENFTFTKYGEKVDYKAIKKYNVLSVYKSADGKNADILISSDRIKGKITEKNKNDKTVVINGRQVKVSANIDEIMSVPIGVPVSLLIADDYTAAGVIYTTDTSEQYAFYTNRKIGEGLDKKVWIELFTMDKQVGAYELAEKVKLNGEFVKPEALVSDPALYDLQTGLVIPQLVKFTLNDDGEINNFYTYVDNSDDPTKVYDTQNFSRDAKYIKATESAYIQYDIIDCLYICESPGIIYLEVPEPINGVIDPERIKIRSGLWSGWADCEVYDADETCVPAVVMRYVANTNDVLELDLMCVEKYANKINAQGDAGQYLCGYYMSEYVELEVASSARADAMSLQGGDMIRIAQDNKGVVTRILKVFTLKNSAEDPDRDYFLHGDVYQALDASEGNDADYKKISSTNWTTRHNWIAHARCIGIFGANRPVLWFDETSSYNYKSLMVGAGHYEFYKYDVDSKKLEKAGYTSINPNDPRQSLAMRIRNGEVYECLIITWPENRTVYGPETYNPVVTYSTEFEKKFTFNKEVNGLSVGYDRLNDYGDFTIVDDEETQDGKKLKFEKTATGNNNALKFNVPSMPLTSQKLSIQFDIVFESMNSYEDAVTYWYMGDSVQGFFFRGPRGNVTARIHNGSSYVTVPNFSFDPSQKHTIKIQVEKTDGEDSSKNYYKYSFYLDDMETPAGSIIRTTSSSGKMISSTEVFRIYGASGRTFVAYMDNIKCDFAE